MKANVVGVREHEFVGGDNKPVKGTYIYLLVPRESGAQETRRVFVSEDRLAEFAYIPKVGDTVLVFASNGKIVDMLKTSK